MHSLYKMIKKEKYRKVINTKSYIMYMEVVSGHVVARNPLTFRVVSDFDTK